METEAHKLKFLAQGHAVDGRSGCESKHSDPKSALTVLPKKVVFTPNLLEQLGALASTMAGVGGRREVLRGIFPLPCSRGGSSTWESPGHSVLAVPTTGGGCGVGRGSSSRGGSSWYRKDAGFFGRPG